MGAVSVGVVCLCRARPAEGVELRDTTRERGVHVRLRALVKAGVADGDYLSLPLVRGPVDHDLRVDDRAGDVIEQPPHGDLFDRTDLIDRR